MAKKRKIGKLKHTIADWKKALLGEPTNKPSAQDMQQIAGLPTFHGFDRQICKCRPGERRWRDEGSMRLCQNCGGLAPSKNE